MAEPILKWKIGMIEALTLIFVWLKLANLITWSWWWITAPLWIPYSLGAFLQLCGFLIDVGQKVAVDRKAQKEELQDKIIGVRSIPKSGVH